MNENQKYRRLAAVMFTDIVGYTALMQQDESRAAKVREVHRDVFDKKHKAHHGEIVQYFGDGTLSVFQSGVEAVECAVAIQKKLNKSNDIPLRIGLHLGDIVFDGTDIYGDGVNVASRIESMGIAGAVLLSGKLNDEIKNHPHLRTQSLGHFELKNIDAPIEVFAVANNGVNIPKRSELKGKQKTLAKSIAVLPFVSISSQEENEYFSDGMTEEIINALSKIEHLKVTSRTSSFYFKNKNIPISQIGQELNVSIILEGSIRLAGNKMRLNAQLIDVVNGFNFWSQSFDRSVEDIFQVQDEISLLIADKIREHVGHFEIADQLVEAPNISVENYRLYLKGRYHILKMSQSEIEKGMEILQEIIHQQPQFPLAYIGMHLGYTILGTLGIVPAMEAFEKGHPYLEKAIELDENLPEVQLHLSYNSFIQEWDYRQTYHYLNKSFKIRPTVEYYQSMASVLVAENKVQAAENYIDTAIQLDPFSSINFHLKGFIFYIQEKYTEAIEQYEKSMQLVADAQVSLSEMGQAMIMAGRPNEALAFFERLPNSSNDLLRLGGLTLSHSAMGNITEANEGIQKLENELESSQMERALNLLILCKTMLGEFDEAIKYFDQGVKLKLPMMVYMPVEPILKPLRKDPRFQQLSKQILGPETSFELPARKYKKSLLKKDLIKKYRAQLEKLMKEERPYLDPNLSLRNLADRMDVPANQMSQLLNEGFDKNFSEYINSFRLEAFKEKVKDPTNRHLTILGLAYESGFNSKTVFNTFFKKAMGKTPKAYWREAVGE